MIPVWIFQLAARIFSRIFGFRFFAEIKYRTKNFQIIGTVRIEGGRRLDDEANPIEEID